MPMPLAASPPPSTRRSSWPIPTDHDVRDRLSRPRSAPSLPLESYVATADGCGDDDHRAGALHRLPARVRRGHRHPTHGLARSYLRERARQILDSLRATEGQLGRRGPVHHPRAPARRLLRLHRTSSASTSFTMKRKTRDAGVEEPRCSSTASCDFDAMELINGKRFDLVRTATVYEVVWTGTAAAPGLDGAKDEAEALARSAWRCQEGPLRRACWCTEGERFVVCKHRNRTARSPGSR